MRNQKGITLILLAMTVFIMIIILGTITYTSLDSFKMDQYYKMCADVELVDGKVSLYYLEHKDDESVNFGLPIDDNKVRASSELETIVTTEGNVNYNPNNCGELYKIDLSKLENLTLNHKGDFYIDTQSHTVYYSQGYELDGDVYYTVLKKYKLSEADDIKDLYAPWIQNGTTVSKGRMSLEVGSTVTGYTPATAVQSGTNWCVLGAEDGKLLITSDKNASASTITLSGQTGYTEGIDTLNTEAKKYNDGNNMAESVRSINVDDINRVTGYDPTTAGYGSGNVYEYGNQVTYKLKKNSSNSDRIYYKGTIRPIPAENEDQDGTESSFSSFTYLNGSTWTPLSSTNDHITLTSTSYLYYPNTLTDNNSSSGTSCGIATDSPACTLLFGTNSSYAAYWLGSKYVYCREGRADFGLRRVNGGNVYNYYLYDSRGNIFGNTYGIRPVVSLKSEVKVSPEGVLSL